MTTPVAPRLVTLEQVKRHLGLLSETRYDVELDLLIDAATPVIEEYAGPVLQRTVTETLSGSSPYVLQSSQVVSTTSVTLNGVAVTGSVLLRGGLLTGVGLNGAVVVYTAGRASVPPNVARAALRWIAWSWRRDHGGSESYMPAGDDATPGLGVRGIEAEIVHILGPDRRGMRVG